MPECRKCKIALTPDNTYSAKAKKGNICKECDRNRNRYGKPESERDIFDTINIVGDTESRLSVFDGDINEFIMGALQIVSGLDPEGLFYDGLPVRQIRYFRSQSEMAEWLQEYFLSGKHRLTRGKVVNVWFHNAGFDFRLVFRADLGFEGTMITPKPFLYEVKHKTSATHSQRIRVLDTFSYFQTSLEKIGHDMFHMEKEKFEIIDEVNRLKSSDAHWRSNLEICSKLKQLKHDFDTQPVEKFRLRLEKDIAITAGVVLLILEKHKLIDIKRRPKLGAPAYFYERWARLMKKLGRPDILAAIDPTKFFDIFGKDAAIAAGVTSTYTAYDRDGKAVEKVWRPEKFEGEQGLASYASYGGRTECFDSRLGQWFYLDKNSLYGEVMRDFRLPIRLKHSLRNPSKEVVKAFLEQGYLIAAKVRVNVPLNTRYPPFPIHSGGKMRFNAGRFLTYLCSPEFEKARYFDMIEEFIEISVYEAEYITRDYMLALIKEKEHAETTCIYCGKEDFDKESAPCPKSDNQEHRGDMATRGFTKHGYTDLSGKFGERVHSKMITAEKWLEKHPEDFEYLNVEGVRSSIPIPNQDGVFLHARADGLYIEQKSRDPRAFKRFMAPYAFITSNARSILLEQLIASNGVYCDTDSVAMNETAKIELENAGKVGKEVGKWKPEHEGFGRFITPKVYVLGELVKGKGNNKNALNANRLNLLNIPDDAFIREKIPIEGERLTTMRESQDISLKRVNKMTSTTDDKRVWLSNGDSLPIELNYTCISLDGNEANAVECPYCSGTYPERKGFAHIQKCIVHYDILALRARKAREIEQVQLVD